MWKTVGLIDPFHCLCRSPLSHRKKKKREKNKFGKISRKSCLVPGTWEKCKWKPVKVDRFAGFYSCFTDAIKKKRGEKKEKKNKNDLVLGHPLSWQLLRTQCCHINLGDITRSSVSVGSVWLSPFSVFGSLLVFAVVCDFNSHHWNVVSTTAFL